MSFTANPSPGATSQIDIYRRTLAKLAAFGLESIASRIRLIDAVGHLDLQLNAEASLVMTDSGGIQEETTVLGVPDFPLRGNTDRPITISQGTNRLVGIDSARIRATAAPVLGQRSAPGRPALCDGHMSERIVLVLSQDTPPMERVPPQSGTLMAARHSCIAQHG